MYLYIYIGLNQVAINVNQNLIFMFGIMIGELTC